MHFKGLNCQIPSSRISNKEIIEMLKFYSRSNFKKQELNEILTKVDLYLNALGIESRYWRTKKEKPIDFISEAIIGALKDAKLCKDDIDLIIYCSVDRAFMEPANASFISKIMGFKNVQSFDVTDACMGWSTATYIGQSLFSDRVRNILIVSAEFPMDQKGSIIPENFTIKSLEELSWKMPSYTIGEAASATILSKGGRQQKYSFSEKNEYADLCSIPIKVPPKFGNESEKIKGKKRFQFYAYGGEMATRGVRTAINLINEFILNNGYDPDIVFPHSISKKIIDYATEKSAINAISYSTFSQFGNLATSSIPSAIMMAKENNLINKDSKMIGWIGSAGLKFSVFEISF